MMTEHPFKIAIRIAGGAAAVASEIGVTRAAVSNWKECPPKHVLTLERLSQGRVSRHEIRPDVFGPEEAKGAA